ncbi:hypothetical protein SFRURICE_018106 [Spodoptera frugiperda]|nr:hypothetical protein SFRURICE_018106 [Spodoptera frugiperda]
MKSCTILFLLIVALCACDDMGSMLTIEEHNKMCADFLERCDSKGATGGCQFENGFARRSLATVSAGLRTASKGSSPPNQNRACGASRSARASINHHTTTGGAQ